MKDLKLKRLITIILLMLHYAGSYAQEGDNYIRYQEDQYKAKESPKNKYLNSISIEPLPTLISLTYSHKLKDKLELTISSRFQYHLGSENNESFFDVSKDPFWFYNQFTLRFGLRTFLYRKMYLEPLISYSYGEFSNSWLSYSGGETDEYPQEAYLITRNFNAGGLGILFGFLKRYARMQTNFYWGIGLNLKYINETIKAHEYKYKIINQENYPEKNYYWLPKPVIYAGFKIGYSFKKKVEKTENKPAM